jgi:predicted DCC family thiol-disulfide oxidoreductase YuxK
MSRLIFSRCPTGQCAYCVQGVRSLATKDHGLERPLVYRNIKQGYTSLARARLNMDSSTVLMLCPARSQPTADLGGKAWDRERRMVRDR